MQRYIKFGIVLTIVVIAALLWGCSDRGTNAPATTDIPAWGIYTPGRHAFSPELRFQLSNPSELMTMAVYIPREAMLQGARVPVLVLLAPSGGSQYYYFERGLFQLAEEMTAKGEIEPMIIACVGNDPLFGGYFYGNSIPAGFMDSIIGDDLIEYLYDQYPQALQADNKRGIGGIGMGAYGAFRALLKHPGSYHTVTVADGPLDFDGANGTGGFYSRFDDVIREQGILNAANFFAEFDSASTKPLSRLFIGAALAFSPHDTGMTFSLVNQPPNEDPFDTIPPTATIFQRFQLADSSTLVDHIVSPSPGITDLTTSANNGFDFHLPFDANGVRVPQIWNMWLNNNLETLHEEAGGSPLDGVKIWIGTNKQGDLPGPNNFGFREQTLSWAAFLENQGYDPDMQEFDGYPNYEAQGPRFLYDMMKVMLKYHSDNLND